MEIFNKRPPIKQQPTLSSGELQDKLDEAKEIVHTFKGSILIRKLEYRGKVEYWPEGKMNESSNSWIRIMVEMDGDR